MKQHLWKDEAACLGLDTNIFFDKYEDNVDIRPIVDSMCQRCPVSKTCFAVGVSGKEYGVWGGVFLEIGNISREFNKHKTKQDWANTWQALTMEK
jgi:hypothetical protein